MNLPVPPPWMADLPINEGYPGGLPTEATAGWKAGKPTYPQSTDYVKAWVLAIRRHCAQCGYPLNTPVYHVFTRSTVKGRIEAKPQIPADIHPGGLYELGIPGPRHRSCAFYAAAGACPYLRYPTSRRRLSNHATRGDAVIMGFRNYGVLFHPSGREGDPDVDLGYFDVAESVPFDTYADLTDAYEQAVTADAKLDFTRDTRLFWTDSRDDLERLNAMITVDLKKVKAWHESVTTVGGHAYRLQLP
jgi:hypothetical protein